MMKYGFAAALLAVCCSVFAAAVGPADLVRPKTAEVKDGAMTFSVRQKNRCWVEFKLPDVKFEPARALKFEYRLTCADPAGKLCVRMRSGKKWTFHDVQGRGEWKSVVMPFPQLHFESRGGGGRPGPGDVFDMVNFYGRTDEPVDMTLELRNITFGEAPLAFLDPARTDGDLGRRPAEGSVSLANPPAFIWFEQPNAASYTLQYARDAKFTKDLREVTGLKFNAYCGSAVIPSGDWYWRVRFVTKAGNASSWCKTTKFTVSPEAEPTVMPEMADILKRIPEKHPRLYVRPEQVAEFKARFKTDLKDEYKKLVDRCEWILKQKIEPAEPNAYEGERGQPKYTASWRRAYGHATRVSTYMSELAFGWLMTGNEKYLAESKRLLAGILSWDPAGTSSMRYNDEAGMPILRHLARGYTFLHDALTPEERAKCIAVMTARGDETQKRLLRILYRPFDSHANRMFYFFGEAAIAFLGDIPQAKDWLYFSLLYFFTNYPVWGDEDGGWHEGPWYWRGYMTSFVDWGDVMKNILRLPPLCKPYFKNVGYFLLYSEPPGTTGFGWGDFAENFRDQHGVECMTVFAALSGNPYWQWHVEQTRKAADPKKMPHVHPYVSLLRATYPTVKAKAPTDLVPSRLFRGSGIAVMNTTLLAAADDVQIQFKCGSQRGTGSHGYESANTFLLSAYGDRLLIKSGTRDSYGSKFHRDFMWDTQSQNNIMVNGKGQRKHSYTRIGRMLEFSTTPELDRVVGEAGDCYPGQPLKRYTREILFRKPSAILVIDRLEASEPVTLDYLLHAQQKFELKDQHDIAVVRQHGACTIDLMWPEKLAVSCTDKTDPPIIDPVLFRRLKEYHLKATPDGKLAKAMFITLIRPYRTQDGAPARGKLEKTDKGFTVTVPLENGKTWTVEIPQ